MQKTMIFTLMFLLSDGSFAQSFTCSFSQTNYSLGDKTKDTKKTLSVYVTNTGQQSLQKVSGSKARNAALYLDDTKIQDIHIPVGQTQRYSFNYTFPDIFGSFTSEVWIKNWQANIGNANICRTRITGSVTNELPHIKLSQTSFSGTSQDTFTLDASKSYDPEGTSLFYAWYYNIDAPNGGKKGQKLNTSNRQSRLNLSKMSPGSYSIKLAVADEHNRTQFAYLSLNVTQENPQPSGWDRFSNREKAKYIVKNNVQNLHTKSWWTSQSSSQRSEIYALVQGLHKAISDIRNKTLNISSLSSSLKNDLSWIFSQVNGKELADYIWSKPQLQDNVQQYSWWNNHPEKNIAWNYLQEFVKEEQAKNTVTTGSSTGKGNAVGGIETEGSVSCTNKPEEQIFLHTIYPEKKVGYHYVFRTKTKIFAYQELVLQLRDEKTKAVTFKKSVITKKDGSIYVPKIPGHGATKNLDILYSDKVVYRIF
jgi:hypothetical protein